MFVVILRYKAPLAEIDRTLEAHRAWLEKGFADGIFLLAGPQDPRTGGVILAHGIDRPTLDARLAEDPFNRGGLADYEVIAMVPRGFDPRLAFLAGT